MNIMRRIRGVLQTALTWGIAWTIPGIAWMTWLLWSTRDNRLRAIPPGEIVWTVVRNWSFVGTLSGAIFGLVFTLAERRTTSLESLSIRRVATWGALGGVALPLLLLPRYWAMMPDPVRQATIVTTLNGILGALAAAGTLHLARRGLKSRTHRAHLLSR